MKILEEKRARAIAKRLDASYSPRWEIHRSDIGHILFDAALEALHQAVPEGYVLVPKEPLKQLCDSIKGDCVVGQDKERELVTLINTKGEPHEL